MGFTHKVISYTKRVTGRLLTSYLRQWTQLIRLHGQGVAPVQPYSCPEMWLYWWDTPPVQSDQLCSIGTDMTSATFLSLSLYNVLLYARYTIKDFIYNPFHARIRVSLIRQTRIVLGGKEFLLLNKEYSQSTFHETTKTGFLEHYKSTGGMGVCYIYAFVPYTIAPKEYATHRRKNNGKFKDFWMNICDGTLLWINHCVPASEPHCIYSILKGTVAWDFWSLIFFIILIHTIKYFSHLLRFHWVINQTSLNLHV